MGYKERPMKIPTFTINGQEYLLRCGFIVYAWRRGEEYLYIGRSMRGYQRVFQHKIINVVEDLLEVDNIDIYVCDSREETIRLESNLIFRKKPRYNKYINTNRQLFTE
jgi:excinuclease UvrABC nuclease subunit